MAFSFEGIALALLGGLSWALYCVFRLKWTGPAPSILARVFGLSAVFCGLVHFFMEPSILPSARSLAAAVVVGILPTHLPRLHGTLVSEKGIATCLRSLRMRRRFAALCCLLLLDWSHFQFRFSSARRL